MQETVISLEPLSTKNSCKKLVFFIKYAKYLQTSMPVLKNDINKSLTFLRLPERHQATLDELHVLMQRFPRVITDMNALELELS